MGHGLKIIEYSRAAHLGERLDPNFDAFAQRLRDNGKKPLQAIVAVMRKLLHAIHGMFKNNTTFDSSMLFQQPNHA